MYEQKKDYFIKSKISKRGLTAVLTYAKVNCTMTTFCDIAGDIKQRKHWDTNMDIASTIKEFNKGGVYIFYHKSKKSLFVSPRDQYTLNSIQYKEITKHKSEITFGGKSVPFAPPVKGVVRSWVYLQGYHIVEHRGPKGIWCDVYFYSETDFKVP